MQITHDEAHKWIHLNADAGLNPHQKQMLASHLNTCVECRSYAAGLQKMESVLRPLLQRQWSQRPIPLSIGGLVSRESSRTTQSMMLATRIAAVSVMFIAFMFSALQFTVSGTSSAGPVLANVPSMPIPSTSTRLTSTAIGCGGISYVVQKDDTLASIASRFAISADEIIRTNSLTSNTMNTGQAIVIPACTSTPTSTTYPLTGTLTPVRGQDTITPGG